MHRINLAEKRLCILRERLNNHLKDVVANFQDSDVGPVLYVRCSIKTPMMGLQKEVIVPFDCNKWRGEDWKNFEAVCLKELSEHS